MACLLQLECNFLHGYFICQLPVEVGDMEKKITCMQGMHIFWRDRTTQLIKCIPWSISLYPHRTIVKKMRTFLEVEGKMGPIPQPTSSQYRSPQPDTNPNVRNDKATEKRKKAVPTKRFVPSAVSRSSEATVYPPTTIYKTSTNDRPQVQEETSDSRPPPLEMFQSAMALCGPMLERF